jgi:hypothetical protein
VFTSYRRRGQLSARQVYNLQRSASLSPFFISPYPPTKVSPFVSMAEQSTSKLLHIDVNDFPRTQNSLRAIPKLIWHPLDHMNGHVVIKSPVALDIEKITINLEGIWPAETKCT